MKFKKYLSLSVAFIMAASALCVNFYGEKSLNENKKHKKEVRARKVKALPELKLVYDTVYVVDGKTPKHTAAGVFLPASNKVKITYFAPGDSCKKTIDRCERQNALCRQVVRHEMEHARKVLLTKNQKYENPIVSAQIAAMNEIMAPASEVIQAVEDLVCKGIACPKSVRIQNGCKAVLDANKNSVMINYSNPAVADAVLEYGISKFVHDFNRGVYRWTIRKNLNEMRTPEYKTPHRQADPRLLMWYKPDQGAWGPLFTYKTTYGHQVDIWNSASPNMRKKVLNRLDSVVGSLIRSDETMLLMQMEKIRN